MEGVFKAVAVNGNVHKFGRILSSARAEAVKTERILIVLARIIIKLAACVKLAVNKLPVIALFGGVIVNGAAAAEILYLDRAVIKNCKNDFFPVTLTRLIDRV